MIENQRVARNRGTNRAAHSRPKAPRAASPLTWDEAAELLMLAEMLVTLDLLAEMAEQCFPPLPTGTEGRA